MERVELLAPAGDLERLKIAIEYGADAVYLGGENFGMRTAAKNFSNEEIKEGVEFAHKRGKKVFVTVNIIPHNKDFNGLEIIRAISEEMEEDMRKKAVVKMAIGTLSYSELEAIEHIFNELDGNEGLLVASKIADKVGITRSVIVNALRKFESAGVIESRSLGMKGTHIRILNDKLLDELANVR